MATNFGPEVTQVDSVASSSTPMEGVGRSPVLLKGLSDVFTKAGQALDQNNKNKSATYVSEFTRRQLLVADAVDQKGMSSSWARTMMRKNLLDAIDANPALASELIKAQSSIVNLPGAADIIKEGDETERAIRADRERLVAGGYLAPDADDDTYERVSAEARTIVAAKQVHDARLQTIELEMRTHDVNSARYKALQREKEQVTTDLIRSAAPMEYQSFENSMKTILNDGSLTEAERVDAMQDFYNQWQANMANQFGDLENKDAQAFVKPIDLYFETYLSRAKGEIDDSAVERQTSRILANQELVAVSDPDIARIVSLSSLTNSDQFIQTILGSDPTVIRAYSDFVAGNSRQGGRQPRSPFPKDATDQEAFRAYLPSVSDTVNNAETEAEKEDAITHMKSVLESVSLYEGILRNDKPSGNELVSWMATPSFGQALRENPDLQEMAEAAGEIVQRYYSDEVAGQIKRKFKEATVRIPIKNEYIPTESGAAQSHFVGKTSEQIEARGTSSGMEFVAFDPDNANAVAQARQLNREVKPVLMRILKAGAHLEGRTDYGAMWEEFSKDLLDIQEGEELDLDQFTISTFAETMESKSARGGAVGNVVDAGAGYTVVKMADGSTERRTGTRAWRNNNPGNIEYGKFAKSQGAVGSDGRFAVFPSYEDGRKAKEKLLFETSGYKGKTILGAISRYAPSFENDTVAYARSVAKAAGVSVDTPMSALTPAQRQAMLDAMERVEGFKEGKVERS